MESTLVRYQRWPGAFITALLVFQLTGCGTLLYPERRGLRGGHLDAGVVILDAIGLLFFLVPGVIAFAVDFSNGCIYLPAGPTTTVIHTTQLRKIKFDPRRTSLADLERTIKKETGRDVHLTSQDVQVKRLKSLDDLWAQPA